ncbi:MAG: hypothetical protein DI563_02150 [Variovorax paradoxus]|uniref:Uncharacterized protein n=1 Tax=Variovorax paradoxus TaxID=34073 RepID=A0A2W5QH50_VARPD|nr:MAG: hypothetical protein DI563_02150 [Variovorax paradoxus]
MANRTRHTTTPASALSTAGRALLEAQGYRQVVVRNCQVCAVKDFVFTTALLVGIDPIGYSLRYCYEHAGEAEAALAEWDGTGHPGGPWIKCKGAGVELLNPSLSC